MHVAHGMNGYIWVWMCYGLSCMGDTKEKSSFQKLSNLGRKVANIEISHLPRYVSSPSKSCLANECPSLNSYSWYVGKGTHSKIPFIVIFYKVKPSNKNRFL